MKSKLAMWSWIMPLIGLVLGFIILMSTGENLGLLILIIPVFYLSFIPGLIFGIVALRKISRNPNLTGKGHAVFGIILSVLLSLFGFLVFPNTLSLKFLFA